jgi:hypothetical protein
MDLDSLQAECLSRQMAEMQIDNRRTKAVLHQLMKKLSIAQRPKRRRKTVPKALKDKLWDTTFGPEVGQANCYVCNAIINSKRFEAGHVKAVANGGKTVLKNLRCICGTCNKSMGTDDLEVFREHYFPEVEDAEDMEDVEEEKLAVEPYKGDARSSCVEPCWLCHQEAMLANIWNKKYIDCSCTPKGRIVCHTDCWKEYLEVATRMYGRRATFMRTIDCPRCLDKEWKIIERFT